jgi:hypothetical protein
MTEETVTWLVGEVRDLLDVSGVGLYEFIWLLRGRQPDLATTDGRTIAEEALRQLLSNGAGKLVLLVWPSQDVHGDADTETLAPSDWDDPRQGEPYVAIAPT